LWLNAGLQIATAAVDGVVKLWNVKKQQCVNTLELHNDKIWAMDLYETIEKIEDDENDQTNDKYKSTI
jgi:WD40 repeat protein